MDIITEIGEESKLETKKEETDLYLEKIHEEKLRSGNLGGENDQTSFMEALLTSEVKVYTLPHVFNARILKYFKRKL